MATLLDGTDSKILLDIGATKSFMSKQYYLRNKSLHMLPKFGSKANIFSIGNEESDKIFFIFPIIVTIYGHMFELYTMVSEIHDNVDLVIGIQNFAELEGEIRMRRIKFKFINRSALIIPVHKEMIKSKERKFVNIEAIFRLNITVRHN